MARLRFACRSARSESAARCASAIVATACPNERRTPTWANGSRDVGRTIRRREGRLTLADGTLAGADLLAGLAETHGFEPAPPQWYGDLVSEAALDGFAAHVRAHWAGNRAASQGNRKRRLVSAAAG